MQSKDANKNQTRRMLQDHELQDFDFLKKFETFFW